MMELGNLIVERYSSHTSVYYLNNDNPYPKQLALHKMRDFIVTI